MGRAKTIDGSGSKRYCILRDNNKLKNAIKYRMESMGVNIQEISKATGISRDRISLYLNNDHYKLAYGLFSQKKLLDVCEVLKIDVDLDVKFRVLQDEDIRATPARSTANTKWKLD